MRIIDIHNHGIKGYDTRGGVDDILAMARIQAEQGVAEFLPTIYPGPIAAMREQMFTVKEAMKRQASEGEQRQGALIRGMHLEGPFLNPTKCGALSAESFLKPTEENLKRLIDGFEAIVKVMTVAPELDGAPALIRKASDKGIIVSMGHSDATFAEAAMGYRSGAKGITHIFNAMRGVHHREPGIAGFGLINQDIYIEVIADPFHLHPGIIDLILRSKKADRIIIVSDTVKGAKVFDGGVKDPSGMLLGGCMTITEAAERMAARGISRDDIMKYIASNPESYLNQ
ncbi:MAG: hypothetical protein HGA78_00600 [Nitrospirales bacterium]|nr:hypothetical protein [Nitrospirales bacterium]